MSASHSKVEALTRLDLEGLRAAWAASYGPPPRLRSVELLRHMLAWRIQAQESGGLDRDTRRQLVRRTTAEVEGRSLGIGAKLVRTWHGRTVEVEVVADGFRWEDRVFASLSACATAIAGSRWNGPKFFGLRETDK